MKQLVVLLLFLLTLFLSLTAPSFLFLKLLLSALEQDQRHRSRLSTKRAGRVRFLFGILLPLVDIPLPERWEVLEEQDRLTQLIREELPKPPVVAPVPEPVVPDETQPSEAVEEEQLAEQPVPAAEAAPAAKNCL